MARTKKGIRVYQPLLERNLVMAQKKELALRFELSEESWLAEAAVQEFNAQMDQYESTLHIERMPPGHLLVSFRNQLVQIPLLTPEWAVVLASDHCFTEHRSSVYGEALRRFKTIDPSATLEDVYPYINRRELLPRGQVGGCKRMRMPTSGQLIDPSRVNASPPTTLGRRNSCSPTCPEENAHISHCGGKRWTEYRCGHNTISRGQKRKFLSSDFYVKAWTGGLAVFKRN